MGTPSAPPAWLISTAAGVQAMLPAPRVELLAQLPLTAPPGTTLSAPASLALLTASATPTLLIPFADGAPQPECALREAASVLSSSNALLGTGATVLELALSASAQMPTANALLIRRKWKRLSVLLPTKHTCKSRRMVI